MLITRASPDLEELFGDRWDRRRPNQAATARTAPRPVLGWEHVTGHVLAASGLVGLVHATLRLPALDGELLALTVGFGGQNGATRIGRC